MEEELLFKVLGNVGVPATICFYTLYGVNRTLEKLTAAITKLGVDVDKHQSNQIHEFEKLKDEVKQLNFKVGILEAKRDERR